jgi:hypothetical protein
VSFRGERKLLRKRGPGRENATIVIGELRDERYSMCHLRHERDLRAKSKKVKIGVTRTFQHTHSTRQSKAFEKQWKRKYAIKTRDGNRAH